MEEYVKMFPNRPPATSMHRLSVGEAKKYLNEMKKKYNDKMKLFYPETTNEIITTADKFGWEYYKNMKKVVPPYIDPNQTNQKIDKILKEGE